MLGIDTNREPIKEPFASQIKDVVRRIATGCLNGDDIRILEESQKRNDTYHAIWK